MKGQNGKWDISRKNKMGDIIYPTGPSSPSHVVKDICAPK